MSPPAKRLLPLLLALGCGSGLSEKDLSQSSDDIIVCPRGTTAQGIDVSDYQGNIDWGAVARSGRVFAYAQVSDGLGYRDWSFARNWSGMKAAGLIRGAYQYFEVGEDPVAQANLVINAVGGHLDAGDLPPMLDIESAPAGTSAGTVLWYMQTWANRIQSALGKKPVIYTGSWWWNPHTGGSGQFGSYPLADSYYSQNCPNIAAGWATWAFWQYSSSGRVPGIYDNVDLDAFNGSLEELRAFAGGGAPPGSGPCTGKEAGLWCGSGLGLEMSTLYRCTGAPQPQTVQKCAYGCQVNPPGVNDACYSSPGPCSGKQAGLWCGAELGLDGNTLYTCSGGRDAKVKEHCSYGCQINPPGVNDVCKPQPAGPCSGRQAGLWCGSEIGLDGSTLYRCSGGPDAAVAESCAYGCQVNPPGVNDACKGPPPPPPGPCTGKEAGLWCGAQLGLDAGKLYSCDGGPDAVVSQVCTNGCQINPLGTDDECKAPTGPCTGKEAGLWCGAALGLDAGTLYVCNGTPDPDVAQTCDQGCQPMPAGVNDQCYDASCDGRVDGAYCGSDGVGGNPALLYSCVGGDVDSFSACASGCISEPAGVNDVCR
jgi:GH25 family lysozyme M1 (1,4-beta-N-acetylmuramidase)